jgi:HEPN domain-containing protein
MSRVAGPMARYPQTTVSWLVASWRVRKSRQPGSHRRGRDGPRGMKVVTASSTLHLAFFSRARQFRRAYEKLPSETEADWPKYLLVFHAVELALKAYLIACEVSAEDLKDNFGHDLKKLLDEAVNRGLTLPPGCKETIAELGGRFLKPGQAAIPPHIRIRYPLDDAVWTLRQFDPHIEHVFQAVARALGME